MLALSRGSGSGSEGAEITPVDGLVTSSTFPLDPSAHTNDEAMKDSPHKSATRENLFRIDDTETLLSSANTLAYLRDLAGR